MICILETFISKYGRIANVSHHMWASGKINIPLIIKEDTDAYIYKCICLYLRHLGQETYGNAIQRTNNEIEILKNEL